MHVYSADTPRTRQPHLVTQPQSASFATLLACAHELADASGRAIRPHFRSRLKVEDKGGAAGFDPVTVADKAAERAIAGRLGATFPGHGITGEEFGCANNDSRYRWIIDPIDGTRAFICGLPTWGTLIGLMDNGVPHLGLMDQPITGERFWSGPSASYMRDATGKTLRLKTRACSRLDDAVLSSTHPDLFAKGRQQRILEAVKSRVRLTRYGGDCYAYCMLAAGFIDIVLEPDLKVYDIAALIPIIERAGGRVTTWDGGAAAEGGDVLACGDPALHRHLLDLIGRGGR